MLNNINIAGLSEFANEVKTSPKEGKAKYGIELNWVSGTKSVVKTKNMQLGDHKLVRNFEFTIDEPAQLLGINSFPNPQEYLLGGLAGCMAVTFIAGASLMEIALESLSLEIDGELDLKGFLGIDETDHVGFPELKYTFNVKGNGSKEQYETLMKRVMRHSPNYATVASEVKMVGTLNEL
ncbi:OsmC family protein [Flavobacterium sp.]|uniref:OsmC family protein n=1 Tax=Flavobacterium sp. TaxID=239 RepID=UPI003751BDF4